MAEDNILSGVDGKFSLRARKPLKGLQLRDANLQIHVPQVGEAVGGEKPHSFGSVLEDVLEDVNRLQIRADEKIEEFAAGETKDLHEVTMAMDEADAAFKLMMEARNKLVTAYEKLMTMQ